MVINIHPRVPSGYRSGRSSVREIPEARSTARTRNGGTSSHWDMACAVIPILPAKAAKPPAASIARRSAVRSVMHTTSSTALPESQVLLHCVGKAWLYPVGMTLGDRIKLAREARGLSQEALGDKFGISKQAVYEWERGDASPQSDRLPLLRRALRVTFSWLMAGEGPPPDEGDPAVIFEDMQADKYDQMRADGKKGSNRPRKA